jgi:RNA-binding protein
VEFPYTSVDFGEVTMLDGKTKKYLRGKAHGLTAAVTVGKEGVTESVAAEIERTAESAELVKIRLLPSSPADRKEAEQALAGMLRGEFVGGIGRVLVYFLPGKNPSRYFPAGGRSTGGRTEHE